MSYDPFGPTHVIIVAFEVHGKSRKQAQEALMEQLLPMHPPVEAVPCVECWWIAEDDRIDGSDNDSAVFVPYGSQEEEA